MAETLGSGTNAPAHQYKKWLAQNVSAERRAALRDLGLGDTDAELTLALKGLENTFDKLPRNTMHFREMPGMKYREVAILCQDVREHEEVMRTLENVGLFPWYSNDFGKLEIVISHPSDLAIIDNLGLSEQYALEQYTPKERAGEPEVLKKLREENEKKPIEAPPMRLGQKGFPTPRSSEQLSTLRPPTKAVSGKGVRAERRIMRDPELADATEIDIELQDIIDRFDLGMTEEDQKTAVEASKLMPSLKLFPKKYIWDKPARKLYRARTGTEVTPGQQHRLNLFAKSDDRAMRQCIEMNVGLVLWCLPAMLKKHPQLDPDDLFQAGLIGLTSALKKYDDPEAEKEREEIERKMAKRRKKGFTDKDRVRKGWSTYMIYWIESEMQKEAMQMAPIMKRTSTVAENRSGYFKGLRAVRSAHPERAADREELRNTLLRLGVLKNQSDRALDRFERMYSLTNVFARDLPEDLSEAGPHVVDMNAEPLSGGQELVEDPILSEERREAIDKALRSLTPREERIVRMYFGFMGAGQYDADRPLSEVGQHMGITGGRAGQILARALRKLTHPSHVRKLSAL